MTPSESDVFEKAVTAAMPALRRQALGLTRNSSDAEDLVQETVLKALSKRHLFEPGTNLQAWLSTIQRNDFLARIRKKKEVEDADNTMSNNMVDDRAHDHGSADELRSVMQLLETLDPVTKAIMLEIAGGASYEETAEKHGIPKGTVKSRVSRAREVLMAGRNGAVAEEESAQDTELHEIASLTFLRQLVIPKDFGAPPILRWLPVSLLRIDPTFQRNILDRGKKNIGEIAEAFDWNKFGTVIVARTGGYFSVIDGQHRTTAAKLCGITDIPCQVIDADRKQQASSFAAINGNVTALNGLQIHHARVAAQEPEALAVAAACSAAGVQILRYPVPASLIKPAQTLAVGSVYACHRRYGGEVLTAALSCLSKTRGGNPGVYRAQIIQALSLVLSKRPSLMADSKQLLAWASKVNFNSIWLDAAVSARARRCPVMPLILANLTASLNEITGDERVMENAA